MGENDLFSVDLIKKPEDNSGAIYRSIGKEGVFAALKASLLAISSSDSSVNDMETIEIVHIELSLDTILQEYVPKE